MDRAACGTDETILGCWIQHALSASSLVSTTPSTCPSLRLSSGWAHGRASRRDEYIPEAAACHCV